MMICTIHVFKNINVLLGIRLKSLHTTLNCKYFYIIESLIYLMKEFKGGYLR